MDRPQVIIHNLISLDGRLDSFPADAGLYYEMAARLPHQAVLTGSGTMLAALDLTAVERLRQGHVWLRYTCGRGQTPAYPG